MHCSLVRRALAGLKCSSYSDTLQTMKNKCLIVLVLLLASLGATAQRRVEDSVTLADGTRHFKMFLPSGLKKDAPLLFVLHGYTGHAGWPRSLSDAAEKYGFALCAPQGYKAPKGATGWNVGYPQQEGWKQDDVKSICQLARVVQKRYNLSRRNTFITGMSNGGDICYLLAYSNQRTFRAMFSVAGLTLSWIPERYTMKRRVPFVEIHGTEDRVSEWDGDPVNKGGWGAYLGVEDAVNRIAEVDGCQLADSVEMESIAGSKGHKIVKYRYANPHTDTEVWLYRVIGAPHCWHDGDVNIGEEEWKFFRRYLR